VCFVVVDPLLLVRAYEYPRSAPAQLLALLIYGSTCATANGLHVDELKARPPTDDPPALAALLAWAERRQKAAWRRKELLEDVFEQPPPDDLRLVASSPLRAELIEFARRAQGAGRRHVQPDMVSRQIVRWTVKEIDKLDPTPRYLRPNRPRRRDYLIHMAARAPGTLVTEDELLRLQCDAAHSDPTSRRSVRACSLEDLVRDRVPSSFDFDAIDAPSVFRAAARQLGRE
jgi:hypothetical protein